MNIFVILLFYINSWINIFCLNNGVLFMWLSACIFAVFLKVKSGGFSKKMCFLFVAVFPTRDLNGGKLAAPARTPNQLEKSCLWLKHFFVLDNFFLHDIVPTEINTVHFTSTMKIGKGVANCINHQFLTALACHGSSISRHIVWFSSRFWAATSF